MAVPQFPADLPQRSADLLFEKKLGRGYFGEVWQSRSQRDPEKVFAVKKVPLEIVRRHKMIDQMDREIDIMRKLDHPHIVKLFFDFRDDSHVYLGMEFAVGGSMFDALSKAGKFSYEVAAKYFYEVCDALNHLHNLDGKAVVHRDIKPENILLDQPPPHGSAKLADFGWSNMMDDVKERMTFCGTADYLAPEMVRGEGHDQSLDMWEMGVLLYEMTVGKSPFAAAEQVDTCRNIVNCTLRYPQSLDKDCRDLISRLLQIKKDARLTAKEAKGHKFVTAFYGRPSAALAEARPSVQERHFRRDKEILNMELMRILKEISAANDKHLEVISETEKVAAQVKQAKQETASARRMRAELHQRISEQENLLQQKRRQA
mmetsp:Transcript_10374/g.23006  ORF Transcript_10374/g.23006 Transcript_10374/m.23006 type:complete len:373 (+) Transcript_10374:62-1180(+)